MLDDGNHRVLPYENATRVTINMLQCGGNGRRVRLFFWCLALVLSLCLSSLLSEKVKKQDRKRARRVYKKESEGARP